MPKKYHKTFTPYRVVDPDVLGGKLLCEHACPSVIQLLNHGLNHSRKCFFVSLIPSKMNLLNPLCVTNNVYMLKMYTFDAFSVCHSLSQTVTGETLFIFWLITKE